MTVNLMTVCLGVRRYRGDASGMGSAESSRTTLTTSSTVSTMGNRSTLRLRKLSTSSPQLVQTSTKVSPCAIPRDTVVKIPRTILIYTNSQKSAFHQINAHTRQDRLRFLFFNLCTVAYFLKVYYVKDEKN